MKFYYYFDDSSTYMQDETGFLQFLQEIEARSEWVRADVNGLRLHPLLKGGGIEQELRDEYEANDIPTEILDDTLNHTSLVLETMNGKRLPVRDCAIASLKERAGLNGSAFRRFRKPIFAEVLNRGFDVQKGKALLRICEGKVSAACGGDESDYAILSTPSLFTRTINYLAGRFMDCTFVAGTFDHSVVTGNWDLGNQDELVKVYRQKLMEHGLGAGADLRPILQLTTSDIGAGSASLVPHLRSGGSYLTLGHPLQLAHKHGATLEMFDTLLNKLYSQFELALKGLEKLLDIQIEHPVNCMAGVMKHIGFSKKQTRPVVEEYQSKHGESPCTAHELYTGMSRVIDNAKEEIAPGNGLISLEENLARALFIDWHEYDIPGQLVWGDL